VAIAALTVIAALAATAIMLRPGTAGPPTPAGAAGASATTANRPAPGPVQLRDDHDSITLSWPDPSNGQAPFVVAGARAGEEARPFAHLPPGRTSYTVNGLNPRLEYCFTVVAVYATDSLAVSDLACTRRTSNPQPTASS
jgi:hypothetical protein